MAVSSFLLVLLAVLVVATSLLAWIGWLLYTWPRRHAALPAGPPPVWLDDAPPLRAVPAFDLPARPSAAERFFQGDGASSRLGALPHQRASEAEPGSPLPQPPPAAPQPQDASPRPAPESETPRLAQPTFFEYTGGGLVPVDPHRTVPPRTPAPETEPLPPAEDGFVWL